MDAAGPSNAHRRWELENNVQEADDLLLQYNADEQKDICKSAPWKNDPNYFKKVHVSVLALLKMVMHARSGGRLEVMGMLQGKVQGDTFVVIDTFALPVEGTETRVNAHEGAYEYLVSYPETAQAVGRKENVVGWYHSHPGYGCWLSGIDCTTQMVNQKHQEPWLAIVVDPHRTMSSGKVDIGAFRTYPEDYTPPNTAPSDYQPIPLNKIEDFGVHADRYYSLEVSIFKTSLDTKLINLLWNKYWANTLSASPLLSNKHFVSGQVQDVASKLDKAAETVENRLRAGGPKSDQAATELGKVVKDCTKLAEEQAKGMANQIVKHKVFNSC
eukprot:TRINITY_DN4859_c0_g1_i1.p1 TRINITY_DN4859_c0_g1~~TRINITY_DN4859_c0_g1_i1.p1  ORF type:complete len:362 (-),score=37.04 TRINITY_DN4859_c0_g1_i1:206-1189(-)